MRPKRPGETLYHIIFWTLIAANIVVSVIAPAVRRFRDVARANHPRRRVELRSLA